MNTPTSLGISLSNFLVSPTVFHICSPGFSLVIIIVQCCVRLVLLDHILQSPMFVNNLRGSIHRINCIATGIRQSSMCVASWCPALHFQSCLCFATLLALAHHQQDKQLKCDRLRFPLFSFTFVRCLCFGALVRGQHAAAIAEWEYKQRSERCLANRAAACSW